MIGLDPLTFKKGLTHMKGNKNSFNYSGFCNSAYTFNSNGKKGAVIVGVREEKPQDNPAWHIPPYLALPTAPRRIKGD